MKAVTHIVMVHFLCSRKSTDKTAKFEAVSCHGAANIFFYPFVKAGVVVYL